MRTLLGWIVGSPVSKCEALTQLIAVPSPLDVRLGHTLTQPGNPRRFEIYGYLPMAYVASRRIVDWHSAARPEEKVTYWWQHVYAEERRKRA